MYKSACRADSWYNRRVKILLPERYLQYLQAWIHLDWRRTMTTLPPFCPDDNFDTKTCTKCKRTYPATSEYFPQKKSKKGELRLTSQCTQCRDEYNAAYHAAHRKEISEQRKVYYAENSEHLRQYSVQYRAEHPEEVQESGARYNVEHREERRTSKARYNSAHRKERKEYKTKWHEEHREEQRQYSAEYNADHHEERIAYGRRRRVEHRDKQNAMTRRYRRTERGRLLHRVHETNRRSRKLAVPGTLSSSQIQEKLKAQRYRCYYASCGHSKFEKKDGHYIFHLEHTIPLSRLEENPRHDINYVVLSCAACNLKKSNKLPHEFFEGGRLF